MHIHSVYFWLWKSSGAEDRRTFEKGLDLLTSDPNVLQRHIGRPASTNRSVIDTSYDYGIILQFETLQSHNAYQEGTAHQEFLGTCSRLWSRVQVYDLETHS